MKKVLLLPISLLCVGLSCGLSSAQPELIDPATVTDMVTGDSPQQRDQKAWKEWLKARVDPGKRQHRKDDRVNRSVFS